MYIKLYYSINKENKQKALDSIKAVNYKNEQVDINFNDFIGQPADQNTMKKVTSSLKGYFVTNWILEA